MSQVIVLLAAVVLVVLPSSVTSQCSSHSNGCSIPFGLPYFFKSRFTPACDKHDVCYACGTRYGRSQNDCDRMLYNDANRVCSSLRKRLILSTLSAAERGFCHEISGSYYQAVSHFGSSHFSSSAPSWCSQSWVSSCLP